MKPFFRGLNLLLAIVASVWISQSCSPADSRRELMQALEESRHRPMEGRLTGEHKFLARHQPLAGGAPRSKPLAAIASRIHREVRRQPLPWTLGNLGVLHLIAGKPAQGVEVLERAVVGAPNDARLLNDLSVAYLARAATRPYDLVRALSAADRAVQADPQLIEARFNRALALEKLCLITDARRAWQEIIKREVDPGWVNEEKARLRNLFRVEDRVLWDKERKRLELAVEQGRQDVVDAIVRRFPQPSRVYAEEELLAEWAEEMAAGREKEADRALHGARALGAALVRRGGDAIVHDTVAVIDKARQQAASDRLEWLVEGHRIYGRGLRQYKNGRADLASLDFMEAEREFRRAGSPFAFWGRVFLAACDYHQRDYLHARLVLEPLRSEVSDRRYPSLHGRILWILGSMDMLGGRAGEALFPLRPALRLFEKTGEIDSQVAIHELLAWAFDVLGETDRAWRHFLAALQVRHRVHNPRRVFAVLDMAGIACWRQSDFNVAKYFQNELLAHSLTGGDPDFVCFAHQRRARTLYLTGQQNEAMKDLVAATSRAQEVADESTRERRQAEILTVRGESELTRDPEAAVRALSTAIAFYERTDLRYYLSTAYFLRARARLALRQEDRAGEDFRAGFREIERAGNGVLEESVRIALYDQATTLFDEILTFHAKRPGGAAEAFELSEQARARQLLDRIPGQGPLLLEDEVRRQLPEETVLVKYVVLPDRLLVWALTPKTVEHRQVSISAASLAARVERARKGLLRNGARPKDLADLKELHRILVEPVKDSIRENHSIVFVPDKILHLLPFATLMDPNTGRYLIQDHAVSVAPSANIYVRCLLRSRQLESGLPAAALVVAATDFDRERFKGLAALPAAEVEARLVTAELSGSRLLTGRDATRRQFLDSLARRPQVIHFAGHSVLNPELPHLSMLLFARSEKPGDSSVLYAHEVAELKLAATRLVVLSACSTAAGRVSASEGATSLARPFLAAGVPTVLASLWELDDPGVPDLLKRFYQSLNDGYDPAAALRTAQLSLLDGSPPSRWAAFQVIGGMPPLQRR